MFLLAQAKAASEIRPHRRSRSSAPRLLAVALLRGELGIYLRKRSLPWPVAQANSGTGFSKQTNERTIISNTVYNCLTSYNSFFHNISGDSWG